MLVAIRSSTLFLFIAWDTALHAQYVQDIVPKCPLADLPMGQKTWSPDCQSYFVNHAVDYRLLKPSTTEIFTTSLAQGENSTMRDERKMFLLANDPTEQLRAEIPSHCPTCWLMDLFATKWLDSERILLNAKVTRGRGETYDLQLRGGGEVRKDPAGSKIVVFSPEQLSGPRAFKGLRQGLGVGKSKSCKVDRFAWSGTLMGSILLLESQD
jgi:hypothetical protein